MSNKLIYRTQFTKHDSDVELTFGSGLTVKEALEKANVPVVLEHNVHVTIDGEFIPSEIWDTKVPSENSLMKVTLVPSGGGSSGTLRMIAAVAIAFVAPYLAGYAMGAGFTTTWMAATGATFWGGMAINIGITILGSLLLNALFPPPDLPGAGESGQNSPALSAASGNRLRPNSPIPRVYGYMKMWPPLGAAPFTVAEAGEQYLYQLFDFGYGPLQLTELKIGDTLLTDYNDVQYEVHTAITGPLDLVWFTHDIETEVINSNMEDTDIIIRTSKDNMKFVQLDIIFPAGLIAYSETGGSIQEYVYWKIQIKNSLGTYINETDYTTVHDHPQEIVYGDVVGGATENLFSYSGFTENGFTATITLKDFTVSNVDSITVELTRTSSTGYGVSQINSTTYSAIRTWRNDNSINDFRIVNDVGPERVEHTMVEVRIKATDQLSGSIDTFNAMCHSLLRVWDGTQFVNAYTSNPAWVYADLLTGYVNQRPKTDNRMDWAKLKEWADSNDELSYVIDVDGNPLPAEPKHTCNFIFDYSETLLNVIKSVAAIGRATFDIRDDYYSIIFDELKAVKTQLFTNSNSSGFNSSRIYMDLPDAVKVSFIDPDSGWQLRESIAYNDGYDETNSKVYEEISSPMTTSHSEAWRLGRYWLKQAALRQETITLNVDLDWLECSRGDLVGVQMDVMKTGGTVTRVCHCSLGVDGTEITVESDPTLNGNEVNYFELRPKNGPILFGPVAFYHASDPYTIDLGITGANSGDLIVLNSVGQQSYDMLVKQISVNTDLSAIVTLIEYAPELFDPESDLIPIYDPAFGGSSNPSYVPGVLQSLYAQQTLTYANGLPFISIRLDWTPDIGSTPLIYRVYRQDPSTSEWLFVGNTSETYFYWKEDLLAVDNPILNVQQAFSVVGVAEDGGYLPPASGKQVTITPTGDTTQPELLDYFVVEDTAERFRRFWWEYQNVDQPIDFAGVLMRYTRGIDNWSSATPLHDGILVQPPFEIRALPEGTQTILLKTVDTSGNLSASEIKIEFNLGDRILENVVVEEDLSAVGTWPGITIQGKSVVNVSDELAVDSSTTGLMWNPVTTTLMWGTTTDLMWTSAYLGFRYVDELLTTDDGITNITWTGQGEFVIYYFLGNWPDSFIQDDNLMNDPEELNSTYWTENSTALIDSNITTTASPGGTFVADRLKDDSSTGTGLVTVYQTQTITTNVDYTYSHCCHADGVDYVAIETAGFDTTGNSTSYFNLNTGATVSKGANHSAYGIVDEGNGWYRCWITFKSVTDLTGNILMHCSQNGTTPIVDLDGTSSILLCGAYLNLGALGTYIPLSSLQYTGTGQGLIQYTSPVHLESGNYGIMVDCPDSVEISEMATLDWVIDVLDISEVFYDESIASGGTTITFTKTYTQVTSINVTLQSTTNARTVEITAKTSTTATIQVFDSSHAGIAATVDIRVQGY